MFTNLSGSLPFLQAELDYRRERATRELNGRRAARAVGRRRVRRSRTASPVNRHKEVAAAH
jgi:hypothetical protein